MSCCRETTPLSLEQVTGIRQEPPPGQSGGTGGRRTGCSTRCGCARHGAEGVVPGAPAKRPELPNVRSGAPASIKNGMPTTGKLGAGLDAFDQMMVRLTRTRQCPGGALAVAKGGRLVVMRGLCLCCDRSKNPGPGGQDSLQRRIMLQDGHGAGAAAVGGPGQAQDHRSRGQLPAQGGPPDGPCSRSHPIFHSTRPAAAGALRRSTWCAS